MKAMLVNNRNHQPDLTAAEIPQPLVGDGDLLIRVFAAGVTPTELSWYPTSHTKEGAMRTDVVPGHEFSGVIAALGKDVHDFDLGDQIFGMNDWFADGATAEFCLTQPQHIALRPKSPLTHELAATVPIGALTAWQGLLDRARIQSGERILIQGAAGAVGLFAVQLAHLHGTHVIATASEHNIEFVQKFGACQVLDYKTTDLDQIDKVDVAFDAVGGDTLGRSWSVLKTGGRMVTIATDSEGTTDQRVKDAFFIVEPNNKQLNEVAHLIDAGKLKTFVNAVVPLEEASAAYGGGIRAKRGYGKVVVAVSA